jgi:hypothetical protein
MKARDPRLPCNAIENLATQLKARHIVYFVLAFLAGACSSLIPPAPKTPAQAVFELKTAEGAALAIAAKYDALTPCTASQTGIANLCAHPDIVMKIRGADAVAAKAIDAAEAASQVAGYPTSTLQTLISTATTALAALQSQAAALPVK